MIPELLGAAMAVLVAALPTPPEKVVRETKSFGTITIPHAKHLALRVACRTCHGPGPVRKIEFTPRSAHATCRNCHVEQKRGPVDCKGCHVERPKDAPSSASGDAATALVVATAGQPGRPGAAPGGPAGSARVPEMVALIPGADEESVFSKSVELGVHGVVGQRQGASAGTSVQLTGRSGANVIGFGIGIAGGGTGRTQLLVGGGRGMMISPQVRATALAVAGAEATYSPVTMMPALGLRGGLELVRDSPWTLGVSATALFDLRKGESGGQRTDGASLLFGVAAGYRLR